MSRDENYIHAVETPLALSPSSHQGTLIIVAVCVRWQNDGQWTRFNSPICFHVDRSLQYRQLHHALIVAFKSQLRHAVNPEVDLCLLCLFISYLFIQGNSYWCVSTSYIESYAQNDGLYTRWRADAVVYSSSGRGVGLFQWLAETSEVSLLHLAVYKTLIIFNHLQFRANSCCSSDWLLNGPKPVWCVTFIHLKRRCSITFRLVTFVTNWEIRNRTI